MRAQPVLQKTLNRERTRTLYPPPGCPRPWCTLAGGCLFFLKDFYVAPLGKVFDYRPMKNIQALNGCPGGGDHSGTPAAAFLVLVGQSR